MQTPRKRFFSAEFLLAALVLAFAVWAAHFWHFRQFGMYEDDWGFVGVPLYWNWQAALQTFWEYVTTWPQGRPVSFVASGLLAFIGTHLGGLPGAYFVGFLLNACTTVLFYAIVRRYFPAPAALCGGLAFTLLPSYSSVTLLTNTFMPGVGLFFLVLAIWLYLGGRRVAAYLSAACTILSYESCFLPFFAVPLLASAPWPGLRRELLRHWAILATIAAAALTVRHHIGEQKVVVLSANIGESLARVARALYLGPRTTLYASLERPLEIARERGFEIGSVVLGMTVILALTLWFLNSRAEPRFSSGHWSDPRVHFALGGLIMLVIAYGLAITWPYYPPVHLAGRITGVHIAATAGYGFLATAFADLLFGLARKPLLRAAAIAAIAFYLALLTGFHHRVQLDYIVAWDLQKHFWFQVTRLCPDIDEGTLIIHEMAYPPIGQILVNSWADATIFDRLFQFPSTWKTIPHLFSLGPDWRNQIQADGGHLTWMNPGGLWAPHRDPLPAGNVILLQGGSGLMQLTRVTGSVRLCGRDFPLKPAAPPTLPLYPRGPLYPLVLGP